MKQNQTLTTAADAQSMTSLEIAQVTGKQHKDVLKAIRNMEPAWEKTCGRKFALTSRTVVQPNGGTRDVACFSLTKTECLYIATRTRGWRKTAASTTTAATDAARWSRDWCGRRRDGSSSLE